MHCFCFCFKRKQEKNSAARRPNTKNSNTLWNYISIVVMFTLFSLRTIPLFLLLYILCVYLCVTSSSIVLFSNTQHDAHARASSVPFYTGIKQPKRLLFFLNVVVKERTTARCCSWLYQVMSRYLWRCMCVSVLCGRRRSSTTRGSSEFCRIRTRAE